MKRALVTGGSGAIGAAICRRLAAAGRHVVVHANRNLARSRARGAEYPRRGRRRRGGRLRRDRRARDRRAALEQLLADGPVQIVVNNAGIHDDAPLAGMTAEQWQRVIDVSLHGFFNVTQPLLLPMIGTRWGRIVSLSSVAALRGNRGQANYAAAKAGLHGATRSLALELATRGVTVNAVAPGIIASPMTAKAFTDAAIAALVPMKRAGQPEEVAALVGFLASDDAGYISGQVISINGAMT